MKRALWIADKDRFPSITCLPEAIVRNIVFRFLTEKEAFEARGTCVLFCSAYFVQPYRDAHSPRVIAMLYKGYQYWKLKTITLEPNMLDNTSLLKNLPVLEELTWISTRYACDFDLETIPTNLLHLRKLKILGYRFNPAPISLSYLSNFSGLQYIDLSGYQVQDTETIPTGLVSLEKLTLRFCDVRDLSSLRRFPGLQELDVYYSRRLQLATMPSNLNQLYKLNVCGCELSTLSPLSQCTSLEILDITQNENLTVESIPSCLINLRDLTIEVRNINTLSDLTQFQTLEKLSLVSETDLNLMTMPNNLVNLKELALECHGAVDYSGLNRLPALVELNVICSEVDIATLPTNLQHLKKLYLALLSDASSLGRLCALDSLEEIDLSDNDNLDLSTIPRNLIHLIRYQ